jgi:hypothetical protein
MGCLRGARCSWTLERLKTGVPRPECLVERGRSGLPPAVRNGWTVSRFQRICSRFSAMAARLSSEQSPASASNCVGVSPDWRAIVRSSASLLLVVRLLRHGLADDQLLSARATGAL